MIKSFKRCGISMKTLAKKMAASTHCKSGLVTASAAAIISGGMDNLLNEDMLERLVMIPLRVTKLIWKEEATSRLQMVKQTIAIFLPAQDPVINYSRTVC